MTPTDCIDRHRVARRIGLGIVFVWFLVGGIAHFVATDVETGIVPPWIPAPRAMVLISGVFELLGAAGLVWPRTRRAAGWGLFALTIAVTPVHVWMLQRPDLFPAIPHWALVLRIPLQVALLALIVWRHERATTLDIDRALAALQRLLRHAHRRRREPAPIGERPRSDEESSASFTAGTARVAD